MAGNQAPRHHRPKPFIVKTRRGKAGQCGRISVSRCNLSSGLLPEPCFRSQDPAGQRTDGDDGTMSGIKKRIAPETLRPSNAVTVQSPPRNPPGRIWVITAMPRRTESIRGRYEMLARLRLDGFAGGNHHQNRDQSPHTPPTCYHKTFRGPDIDNRDAGCSGPAWPLRQMRQIRRSMVMPRRFSSSRRSASCLVRAFNIAVFPLGSPPECPSVPTMKTSSWTVSSAASRTLGRHCQWAPYLRRPEGGGRPPDSRAVGSATCIKPRGRVPPQYCPRTALCAVGKIHGERMSRHLAGEIGVDESVPLGPDGIFDSKSEFMCMDSSRKHPFGAEARPLSSPRERRKYT